MSEQAKRKLQRLLRLLAEHDCDLSFEWTATHVRFLNKKSDVELSEWLPPSKALPWAQGYLIATGQKWARELKL